MPPSKSIAAKSALDVSFLLPAPAGERGFVSVKDGRLAFSEGGPGTVFRGRAAPPGGVSSAANRPTPSPTDWPGLGSTWCGWPTSTRPTGRIAACMTTPATTPRRSIPSALARLDHLIAAFKARGIYVALELLSKRRFRGEDGVAVPGMLPAGGGPAAQFDPTIGKLTLESARALLAHVNPETGLALRDDPVLAWVTLTGEVSLFDLIDTPDALPPPYAKDLTALAEKSQGGAGTSFLGIRRGGPFQANGRRTAERPCPRTDRRGITLAARARVQRGPSGERAGPDRRSSVLDPPLTGLLPRNARCSGARPKPAWRLLPQSNAGPIVPTYSGTGATKLRGPGPYPHEAADLILGVYTGADWRIGMPWFAAEFSSSPPPGARGRPVRSVAKTFFQIAEVVNGSPHIYGLWPHAASLFLRGYQMRADTTDGAGPQRSGRRDTGRHPAGTTPWPTATRHPLHAGDRRLDRRRIGIVHPTGFHDRKPVRRPGRHLDQRRADRHVETAYWSPPSRVSSLPAFRWVDSWKREVADPGRPPFLQEPVSARVVWRHKGRVRAFVLDNTGARTGDAKLETLPGRDGVSLLIDGKTAAFHWELVAE